jgi:integrase
MRAEPLTTALRDIDADEGILQAVPSPLFTEEERSRFTEDFANAVRGSTQRSYAGAWKRYSQWLQQTDRKSSAFDAPTVGVYLSTLGRTHSLSTVETARAAILDKATSTAGADVHALRTNPQVMRALQGLRATKRRTSTPRKARALSKEELTSLLRSLPDNNAGKRTAAMLTLAVSIGLRSSEVCNLRVGELSFEENGLLVTLRSTKASDLPVTVGVKSLPLAEDGSPSEFDAIVRLRRWLHAYRSLDGVTSASPLFPAVSRNNVVRISSTPLTPQSITKIMLTVAGTACVEQERLTSHSCRATFATGAFKARIPLAEIRRTGRWASNAVFGYDRSSALDSSASDWLAS